MILSCKEISLPLSKSLFIRKLVYDFLCFSRVDEIPSGSPSDTQVVYDALELINQTVHLPSQATEPVLVDVRDCGAAYRFLMAVLAVTPGLWSLTGTKRLLRRPIEELVEALRSIGADIQWCSCKDAINCVSNNGGDSFPYREVPCRVSNDGVVYPCGDAEHPVSTNTEYNGFWQIHGKSLHASELSIDCTRSGQFASALLLISNRIGLKYLHVLPENPSSASYIEMTKAVMNGSEKLTEERLADWSAAVYWYAYLLLSCSQKKELLTKDAVARDALHGNEGRLVHKFPCGDDLSEYVSISYKLMRLDLCSIQSDAVLARWFSDWGIESRQEEDGVVIRYNESLIKPQEAIELDMSQNLDLVPVLACMACLWPKNMIYNGVANLKYKESDRLEIIREQLSSFADIKLNEYNGIADNQLVIDPRGYVGCPVSTKFDNDMIPGKDGTCIASANSKQKHSDFADVDFFFDAHNDHRFAMGFSLFALKGNVFVKGFESVKKSYPDFKVKGIVSGTDIVGQ